MWIAIVAAGVIALIWCATWCLWVRWSDGRIVLGIQSGQFWIHVFHVRHPGMARGWILGWRLYDFVWFEWPNSISYRSLAVPLWAPVLVLLALAWRWRKPESARRAAQRDVSKGERRWRWARRCALALFVVAIAGWYLTQGRSVGFVWPPRGSAVEIRHGEFMLHLQSADFVFDEPARWEVSMAGTEDLWWYWFGGLTRGGALVILNLLIPAAFFGVVCAGSWGMEIRAAKRARRGGCDGCGYSRAGIDAAAPCPECGRVGMEKAPNGK